MRTTDFSASLPQAQAESLFLGCNVYRSPLAMVDQVIRWPKIVRALRRSPGYLWHRSYYEFPNRIGLLVAFRTRDELMRFARTPEHRELMVWLAGDRESGDPGPVEGGFIRILAAEEHGYTNGTHNVEEGRIRMIDRFSPVSGESADDAPFVVARRAER